jgi:hypothetical protein
VASLNHETVRSDDAETFLATSPYSFVQYVMWRHLAEPHCRMCIPNQTPVHALRTYVLQKPLHSSYCCIQIEIKTSVVSAGSCIWQRLQIMKPLIMYGGNFINGDLCSIPIGMRLCK